MANEPGASDSYPDVRETGQIFEDVEQELAQELAYYSTLGLQRLEQQQTAILTIDQQAISALTIGTTILPIVAGFATVDPVRITSNFVSSLSFMLGVVAYAILIFYWWRTTNFTRWETVPQMAQWQGIWAQSRLTEMQLWIGNKCVTAYASNDARVIKKARCAANANVALAAEAAFLTLALVAPAVPAILQTIANVGA